MDIIYLKTLTFKGKLSFHNIRTLLMGSRVMLTI